MQSKILTSCANCLMGLFWIIATTIIVVIIIMIMILAFVGIRVRLHCGACCTDHGCSDYIHVR